MTPDQIREALTEAPSPEAQARHLEAIEGAASVLCLHTARMDGHSHRLDALEQWRHDTNLLDFQLRQQVRILTEQMAAVVEAQKTAERDEYVDLRRALLVIGATEQLAESGYGAADVPKLEWASLCAEFYRRYGHLTAAGKRLWTKPPKTPSSETKALIAESLRRRQEA